MRNTGCGDPTCTEDHPKPRYAFTALTRDTQAEGLRHLGWIFLVVGLFALVFAGTQIVLGLIFDRDLDFNRVAALVWPCAMLYISSLHFELAELRDRVQTRG